MRIQESHWARGHLCPDKLLAEGFELRLMLGHRHTCIFMCGVRSGFDLEIAARNGSFQVQALEDGL